MLARAIGYEAPSWAAQDRPFVAAAIRHRMLARDLTVGEVLLAPGQFPVAPLLDADPPGEDMAVLIGLALDALLDGEPLAVSHFWSPVYLDGPPSWARDEWLVQTAETVHRFYILPEWRR
jgi:hypothetical protein